MADKVQGRQTVLLALVLALVLGALAGQLLVHQVASDAETRGRLDLARSLERLAAQIAAETNGGPAIGAALMLGLSESVLKDAASSGSAHDAAKAVERLEPVRREFSADHVFVFDRAGKVVADETLLKSLTGQSVKHHPFFARALHGQVSVHAVVDGETGMRQLYLVVPLREGNTRFTAAVGGVVIRISGETLDLKLEELAADGLLIGPDGVVFAATRIEWRDKRAAAIGWRGDPPQPQEASAGGRRQALEALPFAINQPVAWLGDARYAVERLAFDWNDEAGPWQLVALRDVAEWFPPQRRLALSFSALATSAVLGMLATALINYRRKLSIQRAILAAERAQVEALRASERALEARVEERTMELAATVERLQLTQRELVEAEKLASLGTLVAGVAHELNTPIGNALTAASTLEEHAQRVCGRIGEGQLRRSELDEFLTRCMALCALLSRSCRRAGSLIADFKQIAVDRSTEQVSAFDLRELVERNLAALQGVLRNANWRIVVDVPAGIACQSYPGALGQVIGQLVLNADAHAFDQARAGTLCIAARLDNDLVEMSFTDDGKGMSESILAHVFEPFFTTRLGQGGSGLGLAVCRNIATGLLGGMLSVKSCAGDGSCFVLRFKRQLP